jgi:rubrerythrin
MSVSDRHESMVDVATKTVRQLSRRHVLGTGLVAGIATAVGLSKLPDVAFAGTPRQQTRNRNAANAVAANDIKILNNALYYEHQAIWAYQFAATKLTNSNVGKEVLAVATINLNHHQEHRQLLSQAVSGLGGVPVGAESQYDLSSYLQRGEGGLDSDVNIAKLALALEVDATIAYTKEAAQLKTPALITAGASIGTDEAAHATYIRATFKALGVDIPVVPAAFFNPATRSLWVLKV